MLLKAYKTAGLRVNMLKYITEMGIKEMALMSSGRNLI